MDEPAYCECNPPWNDESKFVYDNGDGITRCSSCDKPIKSMNDAAMLKERSERGEK